MPSNLNVRGKQPARRAPPNRILVFAPDPALATWIDDELAGLGHTIQCAHSVSAAVAALIEDPPPRPQIMAADFDAMGPVDVLRLHAIRAGGWFGALIAIGDVATALRASLVIDRVLARPLDSQALRKAVNQIGLDRATSKMRPLRAR